MRILLAVDGSRHALDAVKCLVEHLDWYHGKPTVELVTVHPPVPQLPGLGSVVGRSQLKRYYEEEGAEALAQAKKLLEGAGVSYAAQVLVGEAAERIVRHAESARCDLIYIGNRGMSAVANLLIGSVASKVLQLASVPVMLVK